MKSQPEPVSHGGPVHSVTANRQRLACQGSILAMLISYAMHGL
jgi:hypothetical protein